MKKVTIFILFIIFCICKNSFSNESFQGKLVHRTKEMRKANESQIAAYKSLFNLLIKYESDFLIDALAQDRGFVGEHAQKLKNIPLSKTRSELLKFVKNMGNPYEVLARLNIGMENFSPEEKKAHERGVEKKSKTYLKENANLSKKILSSKDLRALSNEVLETYDSKKIIDFLFEDPAIEKKYAPKLEKELEVLKKTFGDYKGVHKSFYERVFYNELASQILGTRGKRFVPQFINRFAGGIKQSKAIPLVLTGLQGMKESTRKNFLSYEYFLSERKKALKELSKADLLKEYRRFKDTYSKKTLNDMLLKDLGLYYESMVQNKDTFIKDYSENPEKLWGRLLNNLGAYDLEASIKTGKLKKELSLENLIAILQTSEKHPEGIEIKKLPQSLEDRSRFRVSKFFENKYKKEAQETFQEIHKKYSQRLKTERNFFDLRAEKFVKGMSWNKAAEYLAWLEPGSGSVDEVSAEFTELWDKRIAKRGAIYQRRTRNEITLEEYNRLEAQIEKDYKTALDRKVKGVAEKLERSIKENPSLFFAIIDSQEKAAEKIIRDTIATLKKGNHKDLHAEMNRRIPKEIRDNLKIEKLYNRLLEESGIKEKPVIVKKTKEVSSGAPKKVKLTPAARAKLEGLNDKIHELTREKKRLEFEIASQRHKKAVDILSSLEKKVAREIDRALQGVKDKDVAKGIIGTGEKISQGLKNEILKEGPGFNESVKKPSYIDIDRAQSDLEKLEKEITGLNDMLKSDLVSHEVLEGKLTKSYLSPLGDLHFALGSVKDTNDGKILTTLKRNLSKELNPFGIVEIPVIEGETTFDYNLHNAIQMVPVNDPNLVGKILSVQKPGYMREKGGKLIEATMVVVGGEYQKNSGKGGSCADFMEGFSK